MARPSTGKWGWLGVADPSSFRLVVGLHVGAVFLNHGACVIGKIGVAQDPFNDAL
jgi:hypothetical protein